MIFQFFFKFHDFSMHGTFFCDFPGFPVLVGTLVESQPQNPEFSNNPESFHTCTIQLPLKLNLCTMTRRGLVKYLLFEELSW